MKTSVQMLVACVLLASVSSSVAFASPPPRSSNRNLLITKKPMPVSFSVTVSRLQSLGYLPVTRAFFHNANGQKIRHDAFRFPVPKALQDSADQYAWNWQNPFIRGALVQFERANGILQATGVSHGDMHAAVYRALLSPQAKKDPWKWEWVLVDKYAGSQHPETLYLWKEGKGFRYHTRCNTGVLGSTPDGTWFVYQRLPSTTMQGVFPVPVSWSAYRSLAGQQVPQWLGSSLMQPARGMVNGHPVHWVPYRDPGILWVNYFDDGRGIHYYPRAAYGFPQSAGCVEEPLAHARVVFHLLHYGVPVTIASNTPGILSHGTSLV